MQPVKEAKVYDFAILFLVLSWLHQGNHLCLGIRQSICYLPGAHTFRVPAVFDYIGMLQSLPKLICQFHFLVPVLFFYL